MASDPLVLQLATLAAGVGGVLSVAALLPQAWRILRRRSAADVSLGMYLTIIVASALWIFYAYVHGTIALLVTNVVIALGAGFIVVLKLHFDRK